MAFSLPIGGGDTRDDLIVGETNRLAVEVIDSWPDWDAPVVILAGPVGSGKSHIAGVWAARAQAATYSICKLPAPDQLAENFAPLLLEDAGAKKIDESALFHILNIQKSSGSQVLITSRTWPSSWGIKLADLASRLRAAQLVEMGEPDDHLLRMVLFKLFADRQLPVDQNVVDYLVVRMERSLGVANQLVDALDLASLERKNKITRQLAADVLGAAL